LIEEQGLPPFQIAAKADDFLSDAEIGQIIADHAPLLTEAGPAAGAAGDAGHGAARRYRVARIPRRGVRYRWLYRRVWETVQEFNPRFFCIDLSGIEGNIEIARYDAEDRSFYDWHTDVSAHAPRRKLSISVQLSRPEDYEGGDLELLFRPEPHALERARGTIIAYPSFAVHRVAPVTRGTRWSLVAWIEGPRWS